MEKTVVWWIRRDLRLEDNEALSAALEDGAQVIPLFIQDPFFERSPNVGPTRRNFLNAALVDLDQELRRRGSRLIVRNGRPQELLPSFLAETGAARVYAAEDYAPYARRRDAAVADICSLRLFPGLTVHHPQDVRKKDGDPYTVFTPFKKNAWLARPLPRAGELLPAPESISTPKELTSDPLPENKVCTATVAFPPSEREAQYRLRAFVEQHIYQYADRRDQMALAGTASLSPYLRFGMLSPRQAVVAAVQAAGDAPDKSGRSAAQIWLSELIWREFYQAILFHFPHVARGNFRPEYDHLRWLNDEDEFQAWCDGRTGYPLVDAAMRQLNEIGWMHNRGRMVVASFLVKDLLIDWRWGERYFMQKLVDGDLAANNGGWQWAAGTGTDAAPYFRIFNPVTQSEKHDPDGVYIRRWVPALAGMADKHIHAPWELSAAQRRSAGAAAYPPPLVQHKRARERTLAAYKAAREAAK